MFLELYNYSDILKRIVSYISLYIFNGINILFNFKKI